MKNVQQTAEEDAGREGAASSPFLSEKQRRELWLYIAVSLAAVELLIGVGALVYGFISGGSEAGWTFSFPWLAYGIAGVLAPALVLLLIHLADVGLFRVPEGVFSEAEWQKLLPARLQKLYRVIKGAPVVVILLGIIAAGAGLLTLDGALAAAGRFFSSLAPYLPHILGGIGGLAALVVLAVVWLQYRTRRLIAEYAYRREVLEKTGVVIVDKGSVALPPGGPGIDTPYALVASAGHSAEPPVEQDEQVGEQGPGAPPALPAGVEEEGSADRRFNP